MITWRTTSYSHTLDCSQVPDKLSPTSIHISSSPDLDQENGNFTGGLYLSFLLLYISRKKIEYK